MATTIQHPVTSTLYEKMLSLLAWILLTGLSVTSAAKNPTVVDDTHNIFKGPNITVPGCRSKCGDLIVPYPFGIGSGCGIDRQFEINCTDAFGSPRAYLTEFVTTDHFFETVDHSIATVDPPPYTRNFQLFEISDSRVRVSNIMFISRCYGTTGELNETGTDLTDLSGTPYSYSDLNKFTIIGCDDSGSLGFGIDDKISSQILMYSSVCSRPEDVVGGNCSGSGCCQSNSFKKGPTLYSTFLESTNDHSGVLSFNPCGYYFLGEQDVFDFRGVPDLADPNLMRRVHDTVPTVLDWRIGTMTCAQVMF